jgi:hypothetical protein
MRTGVRMRRWLLVGMLCASPAFAQWENVKHTNIPRTPDGKPDLSAAVVSGWRSAGIDLQ